jgi:glycosyltransferase involved in cell wall biosynthesis
MFKRIARKIQRELGKFGFFAKCDQFELVSKKSHATLNLLIIAPGQMQIPTLGWGAVETIITETINIYESNGFNVWLLNSQNPRTWKKAKQLNFHVILNHSDRDCKKIFKHFPNTKFVTVSHYGFGAIEDKWDKSYKNILTGMKLSEKIICLSPVILNTYSKFVSKDSLIISPNGTSFRPQIGSDHSKPLLYLGKIEPRKYQYEIQQKLANSGIDVIFAGPISDQRVITEMKVSPKLKDIFIGPVTREFLEENLCKFSGLLLYSNGEADALVLYEAQAAGLPIMISRNSIGSQNINLSWVKILDPDFDAREIRSFLNNVQATPDQIADYAIKNYNWEVRNKELTDTLITLAKQAKAVIN